MSAIDHRKPETRFSILRILRQLPLFLLLLLPAMQAQASDDVSAYRVTSGDVLVVTVYGDNGLSGTFPVSSEGTIGYPLLGNISVVDKTVNAIGKQISTDLMAHVANLSVSVSVKEYAPIFIIGDVQKPGKYEFRPGMIALELFALGGGLRESTTQTDMSGLQLIAAQQDYEDMSLQLLAQDIKRTRLDAELNDKPFDYAVGQAALARDPTVVQSMVDAERGLYNLRLSVVENERKNLQVQRQNYIEEITMLEKSGELRNQQFGLLTLDVDASKELVEKGAASQATLRERKRELLAMNQQLLESGSFLARAQQNKNEMERRLLELDSKRKNDAAVELRDIQLDMMRLKRRMAYNLQSMAEIGAAARRVTTRAAMLKTEFAVVRQVGGEFRETVVSEHAPIRAGDVVRVSLVQTVQAAENTPAK